MKKCLELLYNLVDNALNTFEYQIENSKKIKVISEQETTYTLPNII